ncbi:50S ribosomal protein L25/general stress protein Ctc [uncultured Bilophila sp.]|jgi:large subunit ribosomal protein L25|uniref:50S ribosomal protein L25/general stress protein Ctc n=1 Tax=uncultured Bilophila sp. TaxID=529385 RepID=UPI0025E79AE4|nr:50S ribosomal protein L25/general stress protein Ctc [uncultured Bilophila sp.]
MSDLKVLTVQKRAGLGKGANRRSRQEELVPGVFYTANGENVAVQVAARALAKIFSQVGRTTVFNLDIEGEGTHPVLIWETQRDPIKSTFTHIDFYGVDLDKPVKITVPVEYVGVARGTKVGGKLETYREQIQLMAKPLDMPAKVTIDISGMDLGTTIQIADVQLPEGVKAAYDSNYALVSVLMPGGNDEAAAE